MSTASRCSGWVFAALLGAAGPVFAAPLGGPAFQVLAGGWGGGEPGEIEKIIAGVIEQFPAPKSYAAPPAIRIRHRFGGPLIHYDRDRDGWIVVYLSARDERWYQYVYQFAHEYCHLLAHFEHKQSGGEIVSQHQWFEESVCETASLYALRRLAVAWAEAADAQRRAAALQFSQYDEQLRAAPHRRLDPHIGFADWYTRHRDTLRRDPYQRELNELAAVYLLPLFEKDPDLWQTLAYLHPATPDPRQSFADFLAAWEKATPPAAKPLVARVRALFGL